jgi:hypothetical protein
MPTSDRLARVLFSKNGLISFHVCTPHLQYPQFVSRTDVRHPAFDVIIFKSASIGLSTSKSQVKSLRWTNRIASARRERPLQLRASARFRASSAYCCLSWRCFFLYTLRIWANEKAEMVVSALGIRIAPSNRFSCLRKYCPPSRSLP